MEFRFNINRLLPKKINKISHTLLPEDFRGDRRELYECQRLLSRVLDDMGEASANAQGLGKPITSASKLRDTDHLVYLLVDSQGNNGLGTVVGLLKTGSKNLFMFDENGVHYQLQPRCILDFYVHESRQRMGLGNVLYQHMLAEEKTRPIKLAIDRPSEKFLQFLRKHYGLEKIIPQNNKFVVFQGFFDDEFQDSRSSRSNRSIADDNLQGNNSNRENSNKNCASASSSNGAPYSGISRSAYGRYAAARPPCSMANIIHNSTMLGQAAERTGDSPKEVEFQPDSTVPQSHGEIIASASKLERPRSLSLYSEDEQKQRTTELSTVPTPALPDQRSTASAAEETTIVDRSGRQISASSVASALPEKATKRATSAAFGPHVDHQTSDDLPPMNIKTTATAVQSSNPNVDNVDRARMPESATGAGNREVSSATSSVPVKPSTPFTPVRRETSASIEKPAGSTSSAGSVKASPSCGQEVSGNQGGHLDLKFYHSPLW